MLAWVVWREIKISRSVAVILEKVLKPLGNLRRTL